MAVTKKLILSPEYQGLSPVWEDKETEKRNFEFEELFDLGVDGCVISKLQTWQNMSNSIFERIRDCPFTERFYTREKALEFDKLGITILLELRGQLPNCLISYYSSFFKQRIILGGLNDYHYN